MCPLHFPSSHCQNGTINSWKSDRKELSAEELEESIRSAAAPFVNTAAGTHLNKIQLVNPKIKFQVRSLFLFVPVYVFFRLVVFSVDGSIYSSGVVF